MKADKIEKLLQGVMNNLLKSITSEKIKTILTERSFITGGCIPSMLLDEFVNDFDIYLIVQEDADTIKKYYESLEVNELDLKGTKVYLPKLITDNSVNLTDKVQIILKFCGQPADIVAKFDWKHIKSWWCCNNGLHLCDDVYKLIVEKDLVYTGSEFPLSSVLRLRKFIKKGWHVSTKTMTNIVLDVVSEFDQSYFDEPEVEAKIDVNTLVKQLNGVDPLTIQVRLEERTGERLAIPEIIKLL